MTLRSNPGFPESINRVFRSNGLDTLAVQLVGWDADATESVVLSVDASGRLEVVPAAFGSLVSSALSVSADGDAKQIAGTSTPCSRVILSVGPGAADGIIAVGESSSVNASAGSELGTIIIAGNPPFEMFIDNLNKLWFNANSTGDRLCVSYYT